VFSVVIFSITLRNPSFLCGGLEQFVYLEKNAGRPARTATKVDLLIAVRFE
jgi:hypothetical protein